jgi:hypothetical protein
VNKLIYVGVISLLAVIGAFGEGLFLGKSTPGYLQWFPRRPEVIWVYLFLSGGLFSLSSLLVVKHLDLNVNETGLLAPFGVMVYLSIRWLVFGLTPGNNGWLWLQTGLYLFLSVVASLRPELPGDVLVKMKGEFRNQ